jgi:hypothetical protein
MNINGAPPTENLGRRECRMGAFATEMFCEQHSGGMLPYGSPPIILYPPPLPCPLLQDLPSRRRHCQRRGSAPEMRPARLLLHLKTVGYFLRANQRREVFPRRLDESTSATGTTLWSNLMGGSQRRETRLEGMPQVPTMPTATYLHVVPSHWMVPGWLQ